MFEARLIIGNTASGGAQAETYDRLDPTGGVVASRAAAASEDAERAANAAAEAFADWSAMPAAERETILLSAAQNVEARTDVLVEAMRAETGASEDWARFNCRLAADMLRQAAPLAHRIGSTAAGTSVDGVVSRHERRPAGVVLAIAPWNAPVALAARAVAAPLALGNTVVLKGSELCPATHARLTLALIDAGLPPGALNLVLAAPERAHAIVDSLIAHPAVRRVNFTGSTRVGRNVAGLAAQHLKPCLLELSGKATTIVLSDADIGHAAASVAYGAFANLGQVCMSTDRVVVESAVADAFVAALAEAVAGLPDSGATMISTPAAQRVRGLISDALAKGAVRVTGSDGTGAVIAPTVLDHVHSGMQLWHDEAFGPVLGVIRVGDEEEAVSIANDSEFGLAAAVHSRDPARAEAVAARLETGICHINGPTLYDDPHHPFGGMKSSGYGRFGGQAAIGEFTELRWIARHPAPREAGGGG